MPNSHAGGTTASHNISPAATTSITVSSGGKITGSIDFAKILTHKTAGTYCEYDIIDRFDITSPYEITTSTASLASAATLTASVQDIDDVISKGWTEAHKIKITAKEGSFANSAAASVASKYTLNTAANTVLGKVGDTPATLYINEGWYPNTKIELGHMIPGDAPDTPVAGAGNVLSGYKVYDLDGNEIVGTMTTVVPTFSAASHNPSLSSTASTQASVTVKTEGTLIGKSQYGVTTTKPTGTDGVNYLSIQGNGEPVNGDMTMQASCPSLDIKYHQNTAGNISQSDGDTAYTLTASTVSQKFTYTPSVVSNAAVNAKIYIPTTAAGALGTAVSVPSATANLASDKSGVIKTSKTTGKQYITLTASMATTNGSAQGTSASHAAGLITSAAAASATASSVSVAITSTPYYIEIYDGSCEITSA